MGRPYEGLAHLSGLPQPPGVPRHHVNRPLDTVNTRKKETVVIGNMLEQKQRIEQSGSFIYQWHLRKMIFLSQWHSQLERIIWVLPTKVEPMTFWLLVQMLYHWATGDSWKLLRPLNEVHVKKHPAYCLDWNVHMWLNAVAMIETRCSTSELKKTRGKWYGTYQTKFQSGSSLICCF